ncbi:hypothetical protein DDI_0187 [Dickeya dianthicola RNS04.9]|nr:hypothetical protein DDI_0187 [Dickeya dianthicola RNS04.9]
MNFGAKAGLGIDCNNLILNKFNYKNDLIDHHIDPNVLYKMLF